MQEHSVLGQVALAYSPVIGRNRQVVATRLTVFPARPDSAPLVGPLLHALHEVWPPLADGATPDLAQRSAAKAPAAHAVVLNLADEALLQALLSAMPAPHFMIEVPAFMAADPLQSPSLRQLHAAGNVLLLKGRPSAALPADVLSCFVHGIVDSEEDRRAMASALPGASGHARKLSLVQSGVRTSSAAALAFERGAVAVVGWPFDDPQPRPSGRSTVPTDVQVVLELINGVEREEPVGKLEMMLKRDPTLAFRLLRYLNSPAFGLSVEINSFGHALALLGYQRLKRWLALLLASSSKGNNVQPLMHAAVRRGLLMEELARTQGDAEVRGEMFICGVFSLLDRLLQQPFAEMLRSLPVPERVQQALLGNGGPYGPYLDLVRAIEAEAVFDIRSAAESLMLGLGEVNQAVLRALRTAKQLDG